MEKAKGKERILCSESLNNRLRVRIGLNTREYFLSGCPAHMISKHSIAEMKWEMLFHPCSALCQHMWLLSLQPLKPRRFRAEFCPGQLRRKGGRQQDPSHSTGFATGCFHQDTGFTGHWWNCVSAKSSIWSSCTEPANVLCFCCCQGWLSIREGISKRVWRTQCVIWLAVIVALSPRLFRPR